VPTTIFFAVRTFSGSLADRSACALAEVTEPVPVEPDPERESDPQADNPRPTAASSAREPVDRAFVRSRAVGRVTRSLRGGGRLCCGSVPMVPLRTARRRERRTTGT
jgi:hypothetical protein